MRALNKTIFLYLIHLNLLPAIVLAQKGDVADSILQVATKLYQEDRELKLALSPALKAYHTSLSSKNKITELNSLHLICIIQWEEGLLKKAEETAIKGLTKAGEYQNDTLRGSFLVMRGLISYSHSNYQQALGQYKLALAYFQAAKKTKNMATAYCNMGICEKKLGHFEKANYYYFKAAELQAKSNNTAELANTFNSIGNCFIELKWHERAFIYFRKALRLAKQTGDRARISQSLNNLGFAWLEVQQPDSAIKCLRKSLILKRKAQNSPGYVLALQNLASAYIQKDQPHNALPALRSSIRIAAEQEMDDEYLRGNLDVGELYIRQQDFRKALPYVLEARQKATAIKSPDLLMKALLFESQIYEGVGKYRDAVQTEREADKLEDSILNIRQSEAISKLEVQFQTREKNQEIANLNSRAHLDQEILRQQRIFIITLSSAIALLMLLLILAIKSYHRKHADNQQIKNLMREVHHRVKNNLQMLSGLFTIQLSEPGDEKIKCSIRENETRLNSMNLIHQQLYTVNAGTTINMKEYLEQLVNHLGITFAAAQKKSTFA